MRGKRVKYVRALVMRQDVNTLKTIQRENGEKTFKKMGGVAVYRHAKKLWKKFGIQDEWGKKSETKIDMGLTKNNMY